MYTYIPFRQQSQLPVFDTVQDDFNFAQLFIENRFIGYDRVGDANQLALAVTSRLLDPETGAERLRVGIGQLFYFYDQQVTLGPPPQKAGSSDFLLGVEGRLSDTWALNGLMQYNFGSSDFDRFNAGVRYTPGGGKALSLVYRYSKELVDQTGGQSELNQTYVSGQWPISDNWSVVGRVELQYSRPQDTGGGPGAGVQWRVLGRSGCGPAADHDFRADDPFDFRPARVERPGTSRHQST